MPYGHSHSTKEIVFTHPEFKSMPVTGCCPDKQKTWMSPHWTALHTRAPREPLLPGPAGATNTWNCTSNSEWRAAGHSYWMGTEPSHSCDLGVVLAIQHYGFNKRHTSSALRSPNTTISAIHSSSFQISPLPGALVLLPREMRCANSKVTVNTALPLHLLQVLYKSAR